MPRPISTRYRWLRLTGCLLFLLTCNGVEAQSPVRLRDVLKTLHQKRGIYFLYDQQLLDDVWVNGPLNWKSATESLLTQALTGTPLTYRKVGDCYLIERRRTVETDGPKPVAAIRRYTLSGFIREKESGELISGATVYAGSVGTTTNSYGFYSLTLPESHDLELVVSMVGYGRLYRRMALHQSTTLDLDLSPNTLLEEVVLSSHSDDRAFSTPQTGQVSLSRDLVSSTPALLGEKDVLKTLQYVAGVQRGLDGQVGLHVRGGGVDQNLLMLDEAPVYNANHLFGFFSAFNVDALRNIRMEKGGFSARYGGRLSSVVDMNMREGDKQRFRGEAGLGAVASRLLLEGPIVRDKASFLLTARHTNLAPLLGRFVARVIEDYTGTDWRASFYDLNAKMNTELGRRDKLYLSGYFGRNYFGGGDTITSAVTWFNRLAWQNQTGNLRWNHLFSEKLFSNASLIVSNYDFDTERENVSTEGTTRGRPLNQWRYFNGITDLTLKYDADYFPRTNHHLQFGGMASLRSFRLNGFDIRSLSTLGDRFGLERTRSLETSLYADDQWDVGSRLKLNLGGRVTRYVVNDQAFWRAEPRLSAALKWTPDRVVRASYSEMNQFIHLLSNTGLGLPTDLWVPATDIIRPQHARQVVLGIVQDFSPRWQLTVEGYQKWMRHIISYRESADFIGVSNANRSGGLSWERNVTTGSGHATGLETTLKSKTGRLTGWLNYTWSMTNWQFPELNNGRTFYPRHDRRHAVSLLGVYALRPNLRLSAGWSYASGSPFSVPVSGAPSFGHLGLGKPDAAATPSERLFGTESPLVQVRTSFSNFRAEAIHRLDLNLQWSLKNRRVSHLIEAGVMNMYGRRNPFYYNLVDAGGRLALRRLSLFTFVPSLNYLIRF